MLSESKVTHQTVTQSVLNWDWELVVTQPLPGLGFGLVYCGQNPPPL